MVGAANLHEYKVELLSTLTLFNPLNQFLQLNLIKYIDKQIVEMKQEQKKKDRIKIMPFT